MSHYKLLLKKYYWFNIAVIFKNKNSTLKNICYNGFTAYKISNYYTYSVMYNTSYSLDILKK